MELGSHPLESVSAGANARVSASSAAPRAEGTVRQSELQPSMRAYHASLLGYNQGPGDLRPRPLKSAIDQETTSLLAQLVAEVQPARDIPANPYARSYQTFSQADKRPLRQRLQDQVRALKAQAKPCPFKNDDGACTKPWIRCGERAGSTLRSPGQVSPERSLPRCSWDTHWSQRPGPIVIMAPQPNIYSYIQATISMFLPANSAHIFAAETAAEAQAILDKYKGSDEKIRTIIIDLDHATREAISLLEQIWERNFHVSIITISQHTLAQHPVQADVLLRRSAPEVAFIDSHLVKPLHSEKLIDALQK